MMIREALRALLALAYVTVIVGIENFACPPEEEGKISFRTVFTGTPTDEITSGFFPHGNPNLLGTGVFTFDLKTNLMDWEVDLSQEYVVTQAHLYNMRLDKTGDSWSCWGGRWSFHDFLNGTQFDTAIKIKKLFEDSDKKPVTDWTVILHTEGGHFAVDSNGDLIVYNRELHETSVTGVKESGERFNNRVPRKLNDLRLREYNTASGGYGSGTGSGIRPFDDVYPADNFERLHDKPFPDENGKTWVRLDDTQTYVPSEYGIERGLTIQSIDNAEYLFYLYDDQGPDWDYGGPEGAGGGYLLPCATNTGPLEIPPQAAITAEDEVSTDNVVAGPLCFPGDAMCQVEGRGEVAMKNIELGDRILVEGGKYESVYSFGHRDETIEANYLKIDTVAGPLEISKEHMVFVQGGRSVPASIVIVGDNLQLANGETSTVTSVNVVRKSGVYAPFTKSGTVIVNGVKSSCFVAFQDSETLSFAGMDTGVTFQLLAYSFEGPHRFWCTFISECMEEVYTAEGISTWVDGPHKLFHWFFHYPSVAVLALSLLPFFMAIGSPLRSLVLVLTISLFAVRHERVLLRFKSTKVQYL